MSVTRVYVNDVEVGSLPTVEYQHMVLNAKKDLRLYVLQLLILLKAAFLIMLFSISLVPVVICIAVSISVVFLPDHVINILTLLKDYSLPDVIHSIRTVGINIWVLTFIICLSIFIMRKNSFGYHNCFIDRINYDIRSLLEVPADGEIRVNPQSQAFPFSLINEQH